MSSFFYDGRFTIEKINYKNILEKFNIYILEINSKQLETDRDFVQLLKKIKSLEKIKSFYLKKTQLYLLGSKDFIFEEVEFIKKYVIGSPVKIYIEKMFEMIQPLVLLNLLVRYLPYETIGNKIPGKENIRYVDFNLIAFFLKKNPDGFKFLTCSFEKYKFGGEYIVRLDQKSFTRISNFSGNKRRKKVSYDSVTRLLIPDKNGEYYEGNCGMKTIDTSFLVNKVEHLTKSRSYYFTSLINMIDENLDKYISLKFNKMNNYECFDTKSKKIYFANSIKKLEKEIDVYEIEDIKDKKEIVSNKKDEFFRNLENFRLKKIVFKFKGVAKIGENFENNIDRWKVFLLNSNDGIGLDYDGYKEIKKMPFLVSEGFLILKEDNFDTVLTRIVEELFLKEQLKIKNISKLHSNVLLFKDIVCIHYKKEKIRKLQILEAGNIEIDSCKIFENNGLTREFEELLREFKLEFLQDNPNQEFKFMKIGDKKIYIADTFMRLYYNTDRFLQEYKAEVKQGKNGISRSLKGFLGMTMNIKINKKEQLYYSFYDVGIKGGEKFSPNIKKIFSNKKLTDEEYEIFCESLVFKYLSNQSKLASYPFFFKLTSEMR